MNDEVYHLAMSSTVMPVTFKSELLRMIMNKGFSEKIEAHNNSVKELADMIYRSTYGDIEAMMNALPNGILNEYKELQIPYGPVGRKFIMGGQKASNNMAVGVIPKLGIFGNRFVSANVGQKTHPAELVCCNTYAISMTDTKRLPAVIRNWKLTDEIEDAMREVLDSQILLVKAYDQAKETASRLLAGCRTLAQLKEAWPEVHAMVPEGIVKKAGAKPTSLVVRAPTSLNALLNLTTPVHDNPTLN